MTEYLSTSPDALPSVSYQSARCWQRHGAEPLRQCSPSCQPQGGRELGLSGVVNISESLKSAVTYYKPKRLSGLNQKVSGQVSESISLRTQTSRHRCNGETSPTRVLTRNVVSPSPSHRESNSQEMLMGRRVKDDGESKSRPVMGRIGGARSPHAKAGQLPSGLTSQENLINHRRRKGRWQQWQH